MLAALVLMLLWGAWIFRRLRTMHDPSLEEDDLHWELKDWRAYWKVLLLAFAIVFLLRSGCASVVAYSGPDGLESGLGAWAEFWRSWFDGLLLGWPL